MKTSLLFCLVTLACAANAPCATSIHWANSPATLLNDLTGQPLINGTTQRPNEGDRIQLGYYSAATSSNPFAGNWVLLHDGIIGQKTVSLLPPGQFDYKENFPADQVLGGVPLSIRFYDAASPEEATHFNAVSDATGAWNTLTSMDTTVRMDLFLAQSNLVWLDGAGSAFRTTIQIPEPAGFPLAAGAMLFFCHRRMHARRRLA